MESGILLVDKPSGWRSRQVVDAIGKRLGIKKVGHAGTLDPAASGLLVLLLNEGTKLSRFLMESDKQYRATIRLGIETDTYDADGTEVSRADTSNLTEDAVREAMTEFRGTILQTPPAVAAVKVAGKPAYKYARAGEPVELKPREINIYSLDVVEMELPDVEIDVACSKGTYIRSIAHDLGQNLGVGGHLSEIRRIKSGSYHIRDAHDLNELLELDRESLLGRLIPIDAALPEATVIEADEVLAACIANGNTIRGEMLYGKLPTNLKKGDLVQVNAPEKVAITSLLTDIAALGAPPWMREAPLKYERVLHR